MGLKKNFIISLLVMAVLSPVAANMDSTPQNCLNAVTSLCSAADDKVEVPHICRGPQDEFFYEEERFAWAENGSIDCKDFDRAEFETHLNKISEFSEIWRIIPLETIIVSIFFVLPFSITFFFYRKFEGLKFYSSSYIFSLVWWPLTNLFDIWVPVRLSVTALVIAFIVPFTVLYGINRTCGRGEKEFLIQVAIYLGVVIFYIVRFLAKGSLASFY